ncbi:hypothetical protein [Streptomyces sp. NPDC000410]|uniref:hypothetical protein n=1 Tax=Streptomyces sp. NPDC000410 TaxID=3154254 RepID=UPI00332DE024
MRAAVGEDLAELAVTERLSGCAIVREGARGAPRPGVHHSCPHRLDRYVRPDARAWRRAPAPSAIAASPAGLPGCEDRRTALATGPDTTLVPLCTEGSAAHPALAG